jgi:hypothetical protein
MRDTWHSSGKSCRRDRTLCPCSVRSTDASGQHISSNTLFLTALFFGAAYKYLLASLGRSWIFWHPNILLSWAYSLSLISLTWLTNQREIEWSQMYLPVSLHLVSTWVSIGCGILVSLGGCRHLDGLEAAEELWQEWCLFLVTSRWFVRGVVSSPAKRQR